MILFIQTKAVSDSNFDTLFDHGEIKILNLPHHNICHNIKFIWIYLTLLQKEQEKFGHELEGPFPPEAQIAAVTPTLVLCTFPVSSLASIFVGGWESSLELQWHMLALSRCAALEFVLFIPAYLGSAWKSPLQPEGILLLNLTSALLLCFHTLCPFLCFNISFFTLLAASHMHPQNAFHPMHFSSMKDFWKVFFLKCRLSFLQSFQTLVGTANKWSCAPCITHWKWEVNWKG